MSAWTSTMPVISTSHIDLKTADELTRLGDKVPWCTCAPYEGGWFLSVPFDVSTEMDLPPDLYSLFKWAIDKGYDWLRIDCDGDTIPDLPIYDW